MKALLLLLASMVLFSGCIDGVVPVKVCEESIDNMRGFVDLERDEKYYYRDKWLEANKELIDYKWKSISNEDFYISVYENCLLVQNITSLDIGSKEWVPIGTWNIESGHQEMPMRGFNAYLDEWGYWLVCSNEAFITSTGEREHR